MRGTKGITLISLVITVIILLILAVVAINLAVNSNGLFGKTGEAANKWNTAVAGEGQSINDILDIMDEMCKDKTAMITKWRVADGQEIELPVEAGGNNNITVDWGDGSEIETYTSGATGTVNLNGNASFTKLVNSSADIDLEPVAMQMFPVATHVYSNAGEYEITIIGKFYNCWCFDNSKASLIEIVQWGENEASSYSFGGCTNLAKIASPSENTFKNVTNFGNTFSGCTRLTSIPSDLFTNCPNVTSFYNTFSGCTSLTSIPSDLFANCPNVTSFEATFSGCTSLTSISSDLFANCPNVTNFSNTFSGCTRLTSIPSDLFTNCPNVTSFYNTFSGCTSLTSIPNDLFANCPNVTTFSCTFAGCTSLASIPSNLFANCPNVASFWGTFAECTSLTGNAIPLWERVPNGESNGYRGTPNGNRCYSGCEKLTDYETIPDWWKYETSV